MMTNLTPAQNECIQRMIDNNDYFDALEYIKEICHIESSKRAFSILNEFIQNDKIEIEK